MKITLKEEKKEKLNKVLQQFKKIGVGASLSVISFESMELSSTPDSLVVAPTLQLVLTVPDSFLKIER